MSGWVGECILEFEYLTSVCWLGCAMVCNATQQVEMLIDIVADPYDMHDLAPVTRDIVDQMRPLLPPTYAEGCAQAV